MDQRLFFVLGDLGMCLLVGAVVGWISSLIIGTGWGMFIAMLVMMAVGMFIAMLLWLPGSVAFGAMESMVPIMLTGMVSGMVVGMWASMQFVSGSSATFVGAVCGMASIVAVWILNNHIRGVRPAGQE